MLNTICLLVLDTVGALISAMTAWVDELDQPPELPGESDFDYADYIVELRENRK